MLSFRFSIHILAGLLGLSLACKAQAPIRLSLDSARSYALSYNQSLENASLAVEAAQAQLREIVAGGLPQVNATVDYSNYFGSSASFGSFPGMSIEFKPTSNLSLSVSQLIFSGSYIVGIQTAKLARDAARVSRERSRTEILAQVSQAYYLCLVSGKLRDVVGANLANMRDLLAKTRAMVDVGMAEELDYDQLAVQEGMLSDALRASERQVEVSYNMLRLLTGLAADAPMVLSDKIEDIAAGTDFKSSLSQAFSLDENLEFRLVSLQAELADKQVLMKKADYLPTVVGFYNYTEKLLKPEFDLTPKNVIGLNVSLPLFTGFARNHRVEQARINRRIAENGKTLASRELQIREKQLRYNLNNAFEQYESQRKNLSVARRVYESMHHKFRQGRASGLDLTTANSNYLQAESGCYTALLQLLNAKIDMDKLLNSL